ncbi:CMRF35-like molecule 8 [Podarcis lilfordi]|uniref:CMRF35-like molecule 8 n=1 Tax=Podarcis lilfordi TaxID=74358 RepID=A0AA35KHY5_9SAUR|nr:CMRF35-like molecule 8 [Podarcis lilfordi]
MNRCFTLWISLYVDCFTAFIQKNTEKIATEGTSTTVTCFYDMEYRFDNKYWCRGSSRTSCDILGETKKFVKWNYKSRLTLLDNRKGVFWVTMHQLTEDDSGTYWCGIDRPFADIMTSVKLKVNKAPTTCQHVQTSPPSTPSSTAEVITAFPDISDFNLNASLSSNATCHHKVTERNWNYSPWGILRWVFMVLLVASFILIH